jgi:hypothetical protein
MYNIVDYYQYTSSIKLRVLGSVIAYNKYIISSYLHNKGIREWGTFSVHIDVPLLWATMQLFREPITHKNALSEEGPSTNLENWPDCPGARLRFFNPRMAPRIVGTVYFVLVRAPAASDNWLTDSKKSGERSLK